MFASRILFLYCNKPQHFLLLPRNFRDVDDDNLDVNELLAVVKWSEILKDVEWMWHGSFHIPAWVTSLSMFDASGFI
ncbi:hypothetical protein NQ315_007850 [Exocentrus adspersus]|uniref:Uncharacterized protein n=1 Tax=Exocentrus adspersus TaxID=1586481 RepID=A0AAV8W9C7_9CUCU|nr:hypothetical protein NQ315_007850 [Exocentrus adspersus]